jgi:hypothetical protein
MVLLEKARSEGVTSFLSRPEAQLPGNVGRLGRYLGPQRRAIADARCRLRQQEVRFGADPYLARRRRRGLGRRKWEIHQPLGWSQTMQRGCGLGNSGRGVNAGLAERGVVVGGRWAVPTELAPSTDTGLCAATGRPGKADCGGIGQAAAAGSCAAWTTMSSSTRPRLAQ